MLKKILLAARYGGQGRYAFLRWNGMIQIKINDYVVFIHKFYKHKYDFKTNRVFRDVSALVYILF